MFTDRLQFSRKDNVMISLGSEFRNFGAEAENDTSKREVLDLGTDNELIVASLKLRLYVSGTSFNELELYSCVRLYNVL